MDDIETIRARLYEDFDARGIVERQEKQRAEVAKSQPEPTPEPVDIYQRNQDRIYEANQKSYPKGSSAIVNVAVASVIDGAGAEGLARAYKRAKEDCDSLLARGERQRAEMRRQQYMEENLAGSTNQKELYIGVLENMQIFLPPLAEQQRIVAKIEKLFEQLDYIENLIK